MVILKRLYYGITIPTMESQMNKKIETGKLEIFHQGLPSPKAADESLYFFTRGSFSKRAGVRNCQGKLYKFRRKAYKSICHNSKKQKKGPSRLKTSKQKTYAAPAKGRLCCHITVHDVGALKAREWYENTL